MQRLLADPEQFIASPRPNITPVKPCWDLTRKHFLQQTEQSSLTEVCWLQILDLNHCIVVKKFTFVFFSIFSFQSSQDFKNKTKTIKVKILNDTEYFLSLKQSMLELPNVRPNPPGISKKNSVMLRSRIKLIWACLAFYVKNVITNKDKRFLRYIFTTIFDNDALTKQNLH